MDISFVLPSRDNLKYLKWSYASIRKNSAHHNVEICILDDASTDGTWDWCVETSKTDPGVKIFRNDSGERWGHTIGYDYIVYNMVSNQIATIWHADMYLCPGALDAIEKLMYDRRYGIDKIISTSAGEIHESKFQLVPKYKTIVSLTRIEPPLHPDGPEKQIADWGTEPEDFNESAFLQWFISPEVDGFRPKRTEPTSGVFAPWVFFVKDFKEIGGHDPLYRPQSKEDSIYKNTPIFNISNGALNLKTVEELWNIYSTKVELRSDGKEVIDLHEEDIGVMCPREDGIIGREKLNGLIRHRVKSDRLRKVRSKWGEVVVTDDHSLITDKLECITPSNYSDGVNLWKPHTFSDWVRRNNITELDMNNISNIKSPIILPIINNIDEYGTDDQLHDICEFLGFFCADGGAYDSTIQISENDIEVVQYIKNKSISLFGSDLFYGYRVDVSDGGVDTHILYFANSEMSKWLNDIVGSRCGDKKIPDFVYSLPKEYQQSFLYGYLLGDGHLGKSITRNKVQTSITMDPVLFFSPDVLKFCYWKSTSSSSKLTAGIYFLLKRCFQDHHFRISFQDYKGNNGVWNITSLQTDYRDISVEITNYKIEDEYTYVYDLDVRNTNMFIGGIGFIGLHNSDIFNRFKLSDFNFIQTWRGFVYHMTCRGSRFNPTITQVGLSSDEWVRQNRISSRNFIRKWGHFVNHDPYMLPIVAPKYDIGIKCVNCTPRLLDLLELYCANILTDLPPELVDAYCSAEVTDYNIREKFVKTLTNDIIVEVDGLTFDDNDANYIFNISAIIEDSGIPNANMQVGHVSLSINTMQRIDTSAFIYLPYDKGAYLDDFVKSHTTSYI